MESSVSHSIELVGLAWRTSSYSSGDGSGQCVEVTPLADGTDRIAVRDSKNPTGPALVFSRTAWTAFLTTL